jgi:membrane-bound ClpP family serine protease
MKVFAWMLGIVSSVLVFMPLQAAYPYWTAMSAYRSISAEEEHAAFYRLDTPAAKAEVLHRQKELHWAVRQATLKRIEDAAGASLLIGLVSLILGLATRKWGGAPVAGMGALLLVNAAAGLSFQEFDWHPLALYAIVGAAIVGEGAWLRKRRQVQPA